MVGGARGDHEAAGRLMHREGGRIGLVRADEDLGSGGCFPWIRDQAERKVCRWMPLELFHLSENVDKARRETYGDDDETGKQ